MRKSDHQDDPLIVQSIVRSIRSIYIKPFDRQRHDNYSTNRPQPPMTSYQRALELSHEFADALGEPEAFPLHLTFLLKYPESILREFLAIALSYPKQEIQKSRGAIYTAQVKRYANSQEGYVRY